VRWILHGVLFVALAAGIFGLLPRLGGLTRDAAGLRHARLPFLVAAIVAQAISLGCYAQLYRQVLAALKARIRFRLATDVILASFFVSHLTPFGSAAGTLVNVNTLEAEGIDAATTGEAIGLTSLVSTVALIALFSSRLAALARTELTGRTFLASSALASANLLFDLLSLDLMFVALRYQPGFGPLAVAYAAANIASAIPVTPGGLGVVEVTLVAITVGFGAPRPTAVLAVIGYRIVEYWLPLIPGAIAYLRLRLRRGAANQAKPATSQESGPAPGSVAR